MNHILTIAIPTFNRLEELAECLKSVSNAWRAEFQGEVDLLISSNDCTDGTNEYLDQWKMNGLPMTHHRWPENVGAIANFMKLFELAKGKFCWLLSDDDCIDTAAIGMVLKFLKQHESIGGVMLQTTGFWDPEGTSKVKNSTSKFEEPVVLKSTDEIWRRCLHDWGLLSICVVNVVGWHEALKKLSFPKTDAYPHVWVQAQMAHEAKCWGYIPTPLVHYRPDNDSFLAGGLFNRGSLPVVSYGNMSKFYKNRGGDLSSYCLDMCCQATRHYLFMFKVVWRDLMKQDKTASFRLFKLCLQYKPWKCWRFYTDTIPAFLIPSALIRTITKIKSAMKKMKFSA